MEECGPRVVAGIEEGGGGRERERESWERPKGRGKTGRKRSEILPQIEITHYSLFLSQLLLFTPSLFSRGAPTQTNKSDAARCPHIAREGRGGRGRSSEQPVGEEGRASQGPETDAIREIGIGKEAGERPAGPRRALSQARGRDAGLERRFVLLVAGREGAARARGREIGGHSIQ